MKLLKFSSPNCVYCKSMDTAQVLEKFSKRYPDVQIQRIDTETPNGGKLADRYNIKGVPTLAFLGDDDKVLLIKGGARGIAELKEMYKYALEVEAGNEDPEEDDPDDSEDETKEDESED